MTEKKLKQLLDIKKEIIELNYKIEEIRNKRTGHVLTRDNVKASSRDYPYIERTVTIEGIKPIRTNYKMAAVLKEKEEQYKKRQEEYIRLENEIIGFINSIEDSYTRRIFEKKYIEGKTWTQIGDEMNCDRTTVAKAARNYLKRTR